jgi:hypothetical protein
MDKQAQLNFARRLQKRKMLASLVGAVNSALRLLYRPHERELLQRPAPGESGIRARTLVGPGHQRVAAGSASLQADALDFLGDSANYAISLFVVGMPLRVRASAALLKGGSMAAFGAWVIGVTVWHAWQGTLPQAFTMGAVGSAALLANLAVFWSALGLS